MNKPFLVKDIDGGPTGSAPRDLLAFGRDLYFYANNSKSGYELWRSNGTTAGTQLVKDLVPGWQGALPIGLTSTTDKLFFLAYHPERGRGLCVSDGTAIGTQFLIHGLVASLNDQGSAALGKQLFFAKDSDGSGNELWTSDGTVQGTKLLKDIRPGNESSDPRKLTRVGNKIFFIARAGSGGETLWVSDGTPSGTRAVDPTMRFLGSATDCAALGDRLVFGAATWGTNAGRELWITSGTAASTRQIADINSNGSSDPRNFVAINNKLFFIANDGTHGEELWITDGTTAGTSLVRDIRPGAGDASLFSLTKVGDKLFFLADDGATGKELWVSDGTREGTKLVRDLQPGLGSTPHAPNTFTAVGNQLYFTFDSPTTGRELWCSDGTQAGTKLVADLHPGEFDSDLSSMSLVGNLLFFNGTDGRSGKELWALDVSLPSVVPPPTLAITADATAKEEGDAGLTPFTFTVSRTGDLSGSSSANWSLTGLGAQGATAQDFAGQRLPRGSVSFAAGESSKTITIQVRGDRGIEANERFRVSLSHPANATLGTASAEATIRNDDVRSAVVTPSLNTLAEGQTLITTVQTTGMNPGARLYWSLSGEGVEAADFLTGALQGSGQVDVNGRFSFRHTLREDAKTEGQETVRILLTSDPARRVPIGAPVSVTIQDSSRTPLSDPSLITGSKTIQASIAKRGEVDRYTIDVVSGSILTASLTSSHPTLYPLMHLSTLSGSALKNPIAYNGNSADLGMVDLITGQALLTVKTQIGATGPYSLNVNIINREAWKTEVMQLTNLERTKAGLLPLTPNRLLAQAAQSHVEDMDASNKYLAHTGSNGSTPIDRIKATGYKAAWVDLGNGSMRTISSENAAAGYTSPTQVVQAWMKSEGHRAAILDPATKEIGVGFEYDNEAGTTYWLQNFGHPWSPGMTSWF
jgi:ELWxxDGT repeat protein